MNLGINQSYFAGVRGTDIDSSHIGRWKSHRRRAAGRWHFCTSLSQPSFFCFFTIGFGFSDDAKPFLFVRVRVHTSRSFSQYFLFRISFSYQTISILRPWIDDRVLMIWETFVTHFPNTLNQR